jgi:hypothetical protein
MHGAAMGDFSLTNQIGQFTPVEISDADIVDTPASSGTSILPVLHIEITLENGGKLSVSDGVDACFVLELACGLASYSQKLVTARMGGISWRC